MTAPQHAVRRYPNYSKPRPAGGLAEISRRLMESHADLYRKTAGAAEFNLRASMADYETAPVVPGARIYAYIPEDDGRQGCVYSIVDVEARDGNAVTVVETQGADCGTVHVIPYAWTRYAARFDHNRDSDCTLEPHDAATEGALCIGCGVMHGDPCIDCGGRGYHNQPCAWCDCDACGALRCWQLREVLPGGLDVCHVTYAQEPDARAGLETEGAKHPAWRLYVAPKLKQRKGGSHADANG